MGLLVICPVRGARGAPSGDVQGTAGEMTLKEGGFLVGDENWKSSDPGGG